MVEWAERFDIPIYLHEADRRWVMRPSERIVTHDAHQAVLRSADRYIRALGAVPRQAMASLLRFLGQLLHNAAWVP